MPTPAAQRRVRQAPVEQAIVAILDPTVLAAHRAVMVDQVAAMAVLAAAMVVTAQATVRARRQAKGCQLYRIRPAPSRRHVAQAAGCAHNRSKMT